MAKALGCEVKGIELKDVGPDHCVKGGTYETQRD